MEAAGNWDLWQRVWEVVNRREAATIKVSKLKGHATETQVQEEKVPKEETGGNHKADDAAGEGVELMEPGIRSFVNWLQGRQKVYTKLMREIQSASVRVLAEQSSMKDEEKKRRRPNEAKRKEGGGENAQNQSRTGQHRCHQTRAAEPPEGDHRYAAEQQDLRDIHDYATKQRWQLSRADSKRSITWLELLIHMEMGGWRTKHTKEGRQGELEAKRRHGDERTQRWD